MPPESWRIARVVEIPTLKFTQFPLGALKMIRHRKKSISKAKTRWINFAEEEKSCLGGKRRSRVFGLMNYLSQASTFKFLSLDVRLKVFIFPACFSCFDKNANEMFSLRELKPQSLLESTNNPLLESTWVHASKHRGIKTITYRRICHAPSHLIRASVGSGAVPSRKAPRRRHFHFIGWIHRHGAHAATRRKIFLKLQRFGGAFEGSWRINFVGFRLHFRGKKLDFVVVWWASEGRTFPWTEFSSHFSLCVTFSWIIIIKIPFSLHHRLNFTSLSVQFSRPNFTQRRVDCLSATETKNRYRKMLLVKSPLFPDGRKITQL